MKLTSQIIYQTNKDMGELSMQEYERDRRTSVLPRLSLEKIPET